MRRSPTAPRLARRPLVLLWVVTLLLAACGLDRPGSGTQTDPVDGAEGADGDPAGPTVLDAVVVATHPHDDEAFTQGLELVDGLLLESTGLVGRSSIRLVEPTSGAIIRSVPIGDDLFGEGTTVVDDEIWQLTWRDEVLLVHTLDGLTELRRQSYDGEGWGLCDDGDRLIMSDGSDRLTFRHRETFEVLGSVAVTDRGRAVNRLNELECVGGLIWANVWETTTIVSIDPTSGAVEDIVDIAGLVPDGLEDPRRDVANGIAFDDATGHFWVTGKNWPVIHEVELRPRAGADGAGGGDG